MSYTAVETHKVLSLARVLMLKQVSTRVFSKAWVSPIEGQLSKSVNYRSRTSIVIMRRMLRKETRVWYNPALILADSRR